MGDIEDFPLIASLSRFSFGDASLWERAGAGLTSYPVLALLPHAVLFRIFGTAGYIAADILIALAFYLTLEALLRFFGFSSRLSVLGAALPILITKIPATGGYMAYINYFPLNFWGWRIPRPFVSEIFFFAALAAAWGLFRPGSKCGTKAWGALGLAFALAVQTQAHAALILFLAMPLWWAASGRDRLRGGALVRGFFVASLVFAVVVALFVAQRWIEHPDLPVRCGVFSVDRFHPIFLEVNPAAVFVWGYTFLIAWLLPRFFTDGRGCVLRAALCFTACLTIAAYFALPVSWMLLGRTVQPGLFERQFDKIFSLNYFITIVAVMEAALMVPCLPALKNIVTKSFISVVLVIAAASSVGWVTTLAGNGDHMRPTFEEYKELGPGYRDDFAALVRELEKPVYGECRVIGTFDHQAYAWWGGFRNGYSYLPDPLMTTASDGEIEQRFVEFCRLVGVQREELAAFAGLSYVNIFWIGHDKYQASRAHTLRPIADYSASTAVKISKTSPLDSWHVELPQTDAARLVSRYDASGDAPTGRLDLVVLNTDKSQRQLAPPGHLFEPVFSNASFRVWRRRSAP